MGVVTAAGAFTAASSSSSEEEESSDELLASLVLGLAAGVVLGVAVGFTAFLLASSSELLSSEEEDSAALVGFVALTAEVVALGVAGFPLVRAGLAGVVLAVSVSTSESELSEESELLSAAFLAEAGVSAFTAAGLGAAARFKVQFSCHMYKNTMECLNHKRTQNMKKRQQKISLHKYERECVNLLTLFITGVI